MAEIKWSKATLSGTSL